MLRGVFLSFFRQQLKCCLRLTKYFLLVTETWADINVDLFNAKMRKLIGY